MPYLAFGHRLVVIIDHAHFIIRTDRPPQATISSSGSSSRVVDQAFGHAESCSVQPRPSITRRAASGTSLAPPTCSTRRLDRSCLLVAALRPQQRQRRHQPTAGHPLPCDQRKAASAGARAHHAGAGVQRAEETGRAHREMWPAGSALTDRRCRGRCRRFDCWHGTNRCSRRACVESAWTAQLPPEIRAERHRLRVRIDGSWLRCRPAVPPAR